MPAKSVPIRKKWDGRLVVPHGGPTRDRLVVSYVVPHGGSTRDRLVVPHGVSTRDRDLGRNEFLGRIQ